MKRALFCMLIAASLQARADAPLAADAASVVTDSGSQELRYQIFHALADARLVLDERDVPAAARINVYIGQTGLAHRELQQVRFTVDEGATQVTDLAPATAAAMSDHGDRWRVLRQTLAPGAHVIRAEFAISHPGASGDTPLVIAVTHRFEKMPGEVDLEFRLNAGLVTATAIKVRELVREDRAPPTLLGAVVNKLALPVFESPRYRSGSDADPAMSHSRALVHSGDTESALVELLQIALKSGPEASLGPDYSLDTVRVLRSLGILDEAEMICDQLDQRRDARADVASERLYLAEARNSTGDLLQAERLLRLADADLPELLRPDWRRLYGRVLIAQQRPADGAAMLGKEDQTIEAFRFIETSTEALQSASYNRFNLAVALIRGGDVRRGLSWLDLIGRSESRDPQLTALRDRANLVLGWHFLGAKQGRTALGALGRVRSEGLAANAALLGIGWAQLAPQGERLTRELLDIDAHPVSKQSDLPAPIKNSLMRIGGLAPELNGEMSPGSFEHDDPPQNINEGLQRALGIWGLLVKRDERDPSVQEAMLAMAYAYDQLHQVSAARESYDRAIAALRRVERDITDQMAWVVDGRFSTSIVEAVVEAKDRSDFYRLMDRLNLPPNESNAPLYAAIDDFRNWSHLQVALKNADQSLSSTDEESKSLALQERIQSLEAELSRRHTAAAKDIESVMLEKLGARTTTVHEYLKSALLSSARIEEQPDLASREREVCIKGCETDHP